MFEELEKIDGRPEPFQFYTEKDLWTDEHTSQQMLSFHLNEVIDVSSRNMEFIDNSVQWITSEFKINKGFKIVDFGCGPGLYAARLAKQGASVTGIDFSGRSIAYAKNVKEKVALDKYTIIEVDRTRTVYNWLQYFVPEDIEREFRESGFSVKETYSDVAGTPYDRKSEEFAVIASKV